MEKKILLFILREPTTYIPIINIYVVYASLVGQVSPVFGVLNFLCLIFNVYISIDISNKKIDEKRMEDLSRKKVSKKLINKWSKLI